MKFVNTSIMTTMNTMVTMNTHPMTFTSIMVMVMDTMMGVVLEVEEVLEAEEVLEVSPLEGEGEVLEVDLSRNHSIQVLNLKLKGKKVQKFSRNLLIQKLKLQELQCKENPLIKRPYLIHLVSQKMNKISTLKIINSHFIQSSKKFRRLSLSRSQFYYDCLERSMHSD